MDLLGIVNFINKLPSKRGVSVSQYNNSSEQLEKGNYIANILVRTLYSNDVNNAECYRIIKIFKEKVLGDMEL